MYTYTYIYLYKCIYIYTCIYLFIYIIYPQFEVYQPQKRRTVGHLEIMGNMSSMTFWKHASIAGMATG